MSKKSKQKTLSKDHRKLKELVSRHKAVLLLSVLLLIVMFFSVLFPKYKDWDNAQLIKGLARDFPIAVANIEQATGGSLEIRTNCGVTTEKFSDGVKVCEIIVVESIEDVEVDKLIDSIEKSNFVKGKIYENNLGYDFAYKTKNSCGLGIGARGDNVISFSCITAVREANTQLAIEEFSKVIENRQAL